MLGMILKDFYILKNQGKVLLLFVLISLGMVIFNSDFTFPIIMITMIASMFTVSTIAYDEYDNGFNFLMTLPFSRKRYAISKYLFASLVGIVANIGMTLLVLGLVFMSHRMICIEEFMVTVITGFLISQMTVSIFIPFNLKFGSEKGRLVMILVFLMIGLGGYFVVEAFSGVHLEMFDFVLMIVSSTTAFLFTVFVLCFMVWLFSMLISIRIMKKKEF